MILNFIMGFFFGLLFALILLLTMAWSNVQKKRGNNSSTFDWDKGEYSKGLKSFEDKES